jgi:hypothetical protein
MKMKSMMRCVAITALAVASMGINAFAAASADPAAAADSGGYIAIKDMGFEAASVYPLYVDNSTNANPDDKWVEIKDTSNTTLLVLDMSKTRINTETWLMEVSNAYYENDIKPLIENAKQHI